MKKNCSKTVIKGIVVGVFIGCAVGVLGLMKVIPLGDYLSLTELIIKGGIGAIVLIIDVLCVWAFIRPRMTEKIFREGEPVIGRIEESVMISHPKHYGDPERIRPARFSFTVSYSVDGKLYRRELSPTCLTTKRELDPQSTDEGEPIRLKYLKSRPKEVVIDCEALINGMRAEFRASRVHFIMIPVVVTLGYVLGLTVFK